MLDPLPPYAELLGLRTERGADGALLWVMPFGEQVVGRPGFLHGGAIAGLLEFAALGTLYDELGPGATARPINVSVDFKRGGIESRHLRFGNRERSRQLCCECRGPRPAPRPGKADRRSPDQIATEAL